MAAKPGWYAAATRGWAALETLCWKVADGAFPFCLFFLAATQTLSALAANFDTTSDTLPENSVNPPQFASA